MAVKKKRSVHRMTPTEQHARFVEAAKAAEADESPDSLDRAFNKLRVRNTDVPKKK